MNLDEKILKQLESGELNKAAENLYQYFGSVYSVVKKRGASIDDAKDLFQEGVMVLIKKVLDDKEEIRASLKTYLTTICKYNWNNKINKLSNRKTSALEAGDIYSAHQSTKDFELEENSFDMMAKVLNSIGDKCKSILNLFYIDQKSLPEVAELMSFSSVNSAKTQKYKCIEKARKMARELSAESSIENI